MFNFFQKKKKKPDFLEHYERRFSTKTGGDTPIGALRFVILDTETTGLDPATARMLSFGGIAATAMSLNLEDSLEIVLQHGHAKVGKTAQIHGILKSHVERGTAPGRALRQVIEFIGDSVLVGHHIAFDLKMLDKTLEGQFPGSKLKNRAIDTADLSLRLEHFNDGYIFRPEDYTLDALGQRYNIPLADRHTAAGDAFITGQLFLKLLGKCKARKITSLKALLKKPGPH